MQKTNATCCALVVLGLVAVHAVGVAHAQLAPEALAKAQENFKSANAGGSGALSAAEFKAFIDLNAGAGIGRAPKIKANNAYDRAFSHVDANKDGKITWEEYVAAQ